MIEIVLDFISGKGDIISNDAIPSEIAECRVALSKIERVLRVNPNVSGFKINVSGSNISFSKLDERINGNNSGMVVLKKFCKDNFGY